MAIDKPLRDITAADILGLIDARRREDRTTEYKGHWSGDPDAMLKPISAFANTDGGDLIFGIVAKDGIPTDALGIESNEVEQAMVRSMQLARSGLQPPLPVRNLNFQHVALGNGRMVLILRVPPSWAQPHQIRSTNVFYGRNSTESYRLDTTELRQRFLMADSIHTRARGFIETRIAQIRRDGALPVPTPSPKLAFHVVPLRAFTGQLLEIGHKVTQLPKFLPLECYNTGITA